MLDENILDDICLQRQPYLIVFKYLLLLFRLLLNLILHIRLLLDQPPRLLLHQLTFHAQFVIHCILRMSSRSKS